MIINYNVPVIKTLNQLNKTNKKVASAVEKLSSGLQINRAGDDAAGLAISEKMRAQIRGLGQAHRNIQDGISLIQTAEGGLSNILSPPLERMRELAVQAANDTLTEEDRAAVQDEIEQIKQGIEQIVQNTNFNGVPLLKGIRDSIPHNPARNPNQFLGIDLSGTQFASSDGVNWSVQATTGAGINTNGLTWGDNQFVVVGNNGLIRTSVDGTSWVNQNSGTSNTLHNVIYGNNQYVAVGSNGTILTSSNGSDWTAQTSGTTENIINVLWNGNQYVAVGGRATILTSDDGVTWTTRYSGVSNTLRAIEWDGSQYVVMGDNGKFLTSSDGKSWAYHSTGISSNFVDVARNDNTFVAITDDGSILSSSNGNNWTIQVSSSRNWLNDIAWSGSQFVITGGTPTAKEMILSSSDGLSWTTRMSGTYAPIQAMVWAGNTDSEQVDNSLKPIVFSLQVGPNANQSVQISINDAGIESIGIADVNVLTRNGWEAAIDRVDQAIGKIISERTKLGSMQNRLEHAMNNNENYEENLTAAESQIRDADIAKSVMEQTRNSILAQAAQAMLAQSQQASQGVLQLLR
ncbi:hypothetical protein B5V88_02005 [Heyndrickxia sporothermodurans]|uniref:Flagellin n=2 Tax=Heyndrickxia sporothermodurans TaxID=46224 RepID=A0AB37H6C2_9BACI|nr:flagellin [Heyndrickxia sporothermodurans]MBL5767282.1 hypothetical protein [Heyndrickxia sporothermodurans]MBL5770817.1 hypothetical protein [Heyndrickxia sporothermodurans]MBL5774597.1 hypothetical protein [Heyndrickxia sporothermodurans]MBL5777909.1 hypothetical protein [Heyndrickxia sporothermodurans]MBL5781513.1 hypothetical protein [Heyndrickxia sporothermodurans]